MDSCRGSVDGQRALLASLKVGSRSKQHLPSKLQSRQRGSWRGKLPRAACGPAAWRAVLSVYIWSNFNFHIATALAQRLARKKQGGQVGFVLPREVWQQRLHESVTEAAIKEVISAEKGMWKRAEIAAKQFMAELDTVKWLAKQNACHGVAPQAAGVYAHYTSLLWAGGVESKTLVGRSLVLGFEDFNCAGRSGDGGSSKHPWTTPTKPQERPDQRAPKRFHFRFPPMQTDGKGSLPFRAPILDWNVDCF